MVSFVWAHLVSYPVPLSISYAWGFGFLSAVALGVQLVSGLLLSAGYLSDAGLAFSSVESSVMRDLWSGFVLRFLHANGASAFFVVVYAHLFRGVFFGLFASSPWPWLLGVLLYGMMMGIAFIGYVLPWGQMSFWGATVITNMVSVLPFGIGASLLQWVWGEYSVGAVTLRRFYSVHFALPFVLAAAALGHVLVLHTEGSSNRVGIESRSLVLPFYPYCYVKDMVGVCVFGISLVCVASWFPFALGHADNAIQANAMVTPHHIVPEWYFLAYYAMLRSVPHKAVGVALMATGVLVLCSFAFARLEVRSGSVSRLVRYSAFGFIVAFVVLGVLGGRGTDTWNLGLCWLAMVPYFGYGLVALPLIGAVQSRAVVATVDFDDYGVAVLKVDGVPIRAAMAFGDRHADGPTPRSCFAE
jgi:quinol-cytochrome oxidoreductase complex cytochrome b subunit